MLYSKKRHKSQPYTLTLIWVTAAFVCVQLDASGDTLEDQISFKQRCLQWGLKSWNWDPIDLAQLWGVTIGGTNGSFNFTSNVSSSKFIIIQLLAYLGLFFFNSEYLELLTYTYCNSLMLFVLKNIFCCLLKACIQYKNFHHWRAFFICLIVLLHTFITVCTTPGDNCFGHWNSTQLSNDSWI